MNATADKLLVELMQLPLVEREEVVARMYEISDDEAEVDLGPEWAEEIRRRIADYESGKVKGIPLAEARRMMFEEDEEDASP